MKHAVRDYLAVSGNVLVNERIDSLDRENIFSAGDIGKLLRLNKQHLVKHIHQWKVARGHDISDDSVFFHRGFTSGLPPMSDYQEPGFITSYSLALTVAESFANRTARRPITQLHVHWVDVMSRVLYFAPFLDSRIQPYEVEAAVIPYSVRRTLRLVHEEADVIDFEVAEYRSGEKRQP